MVLKAPAIALFYLFVSSPVFGQAPDPSTLQGGSSTVSANTGILENSSPLALSLVSSNYNGDQTRLDLGNDSWVRLHNGAFAHKKTDCTVPGRGLDLLWTRAYQSRSIRNGPFGKGWTSPYLDQFIMKVFVPNNLQYPQGPKTTYILHSSGDGRTTIFQYKNQKWRSPQNVQAVIVEEGGLYKLIHENGLKVSFTQPQTASNAIQLGPLWAFTNPSLSAGRLTSIEDQTGNKIQFSYNGQNQLTQLTDSLNRIYSIAYFSTGRVKSFSDFTGRTWFYGYDDEDNLTTVLTPPVGNPTARLEYSYFYGPGNKMTEAVWPEGSLFTNSYDPENGALLTHTWSPSSVWSFVYGEAEGLRTGPPIYTPPDSPWGPVPPAPAIRVVDVSDPNGNQTAFRIHPIYRTILSIEKKTNRNINPLDPPSFLSHFSYVPGEESEGDSTGVINGISFPVSPEPNKTPDEFVRWTEGGLGFLDLIDKDSNPVLSWVGGKGTWRSFLGFGREKYLVTPDAFSNLVPDGSGGYQLFEDGISPPTHPVGGSVPNAGDRYYTEHIYDSEEGLLGDVNGDGITNQKKGNRVMTVHPTVKTFGQAFSSHEDQPAFETYRYNNRGQKIAKFNSLGAKTELKYWPATTPGGFDSGGQPLSASAAVNSPTALGGYLAMEIEDAVQSDGQSHLALTTIYRYDARGNLTEKIDPRGNVVFKRTFDLLNRLVSEKKFVTSTQGSLMEIETIQEYDGNGNRIAERVHNLRASGVVDSTNPWIDAIFVYDSQQGRLIEERREIGEGVFATTRYRHDRNGNLVLEVTPKAQGGMGMDTKAIRSWVYDERNQPYEETTGGLTNLWKAQHPYIDLGSLGIPTSSDSYPDKASRYMTYGADGQLIREVDPEGHVTQIDLDSQGRPEAVTDGAGNKTRFEYNMRDQVVRETKHEGPQEILLADKENVYDERGRLVETRERFFKLGTNNLPVDLPGSPVVTSFLYDTEGKLLESVDARGLRTINAYDLAGRKELVTDHAGNQKQTIYDDNGNPIQVLTHEWEDGSLRTFETSSVFDELNRRIAQITHNGAQQYTTAFQYDGRGLQTKIVTPMGNSTLRTYDSLGRLVAEKRDQVQGSCGSSDESGCVQNAWIYDRNGNLLSFQDGEEKLVVFTYDALDRLSTTKIGSDPVTQQTYYRTGTLKRLTQPDGTIAEHSYDGANRLTLKAITPVQTHGSGLDVVAEAFTYDGRNRIRTAENYVDWGLVTMLRGRVERKYDSSSNVREETLILDGISNSLAQEFDSNGNLTRRTYPSGGLFVDYVQDPVADRVREIRLFGIPFFTFEYSGAQRTLRRHTASPGGLSWKTENSYDDAKRRTQIRHAFTSIPVFDQLLAGFQYGFDSDSRRTHVSRLHDAGAKGDKYHYDALGELTRMEQGVPQNQLTLPFPSAWESFIEFVYDKAENRDSVNVNGSPIDFQVEADNNQYSQVGASDLQYDLNGNLLNDGQLLYKYDALNRLVEVRDLNAPLSFKARFFYDALGRRILKTTPQLTRREIWSGNDLLEQHDSGTAGTFVRQLVHGRDLDEVLLVGVNGIGYFPLEDHLGSATHLVNGAGQTMEKYTYGPYGNIGVFDGNGNPLAESLVGNPSLFAGRSYEAECGLYYMRARYYSPKLGRFISNDPIGINGGLNLYAYCVNDPVNRNDVMGTSPDDLAQQEASFGKYVWGLVEIAGGEYAAVSGALSSVPAPKSVRVGAVVGGVNLARDGQQLCNQNRPTWLGGVTQKFPGEVDDLSFRNGTPPPAKSLVLQPGQTAMTSGKGWNALVDKNGMTVVYHGPTGSLTKDGRVKLEKWADYTVTNKEGKVVSGRIGGETFTVDSAGKWVFDESPDGYKAVYNHEKQPPTTTLTYRDGSSAEYDQKGKKIAEWDATGRQIFPPVAETPVPAQQTNCITNDWVPPEPIPGCFFPIDPALLHHDY